MTTELPQNLFWAIGSTFFPVSIVGENIDIDTATTPEDVWSPGGKVYLPSDVATTTIVSSSSEDLDLQTGAYEVYVEGLIGGFVSASEVVTLNGTNAVTLSNGYMRINRAYVGQCGSAETNVGTIQIKHGANVLSEIQAGHGETQNAVYTVPVGYKGFLKKFSVGVSDDQSGQYADAHLLVRSNVAPITGWRTVRDNIVISGNLYHVDIPEYTALVRAGDDIVVRVFVVSSNDVRVYAEFGLHLFITS